MEAIIKGRDKYRLPTMKRPDFLVQGVYNETPDFADVLNFFFSTVNGLLRTTGLHISAYIFMLHRGTPLGRTTGAHVKVY
jgi:hypothetical protein